MKNNFEKIVFEKKRGDSVVSGVAVLGMAVLVTYMLLTILFNYFTTLNSVEDVNMLTRTYLLKMELKGCLEQNDVDELIDDLMACGVTEIQISGNFASGVSSSKIAVNYGKAEYSQKVVLTIQGKQNVGTKMINFLGTEFDISKPDVTINITKKGISVK